MTGRNSSITVNVYTDGPTGHANVTFDGYGGGLTVGANQARGMGRYQYEMGSEYWSRPTISATYQTTPEQYQQVGIDWHIFPNTVILPMASNCLVYRARPYGNDPDKCIFEVSHIERVAKEDIRKVMPERNDDIYDRAFWGEILLQDFQQMEATHKGIKSKGYMGPRLNPEQEKPVENFHRTYHQYLADG